MIRPSSLCLRLASVFLFCPALQAQELPGDWSSSYVAHQWHGKCEQPGRGGCRDGNTYYFDSDKGLLVRFVTYDQKVTQLYVSSTKGSCTSGTLSIDGVATIELAGNGSYCGVVGGKQFREAARITNPRSQLDIGMFRDARIIKLDINLSDGATVNAEIPMQGMGEQLDAAKGS